MEPDEVIDTIKQQVVTAKRSGDNLHADALLTYLDDLKRHTGESQQLRQLRYDGTLAAYNANQEHSIEMMKAVLEASKSALHYVVLINGGAVVALLGTLGSLAGRVSSAAGHAVPSTANALAQLLALPLLQFGSGVLCGAVGFSLRYFSQALFTEAFNRELKENGSGRNKEKIAVGMRWAAIAAVILGFIAFGLGVGNSFNAIRLSFK